VLFVENHAPTAKIIRQNLESLEIRQGAIVFAMDALRALEKLKQRQKATAFAYDFIFLDPPYAAAEEYQRVMNFLGTAPLVNENTIVIAEHTRKFELAEEFGALERFRVLKQGDAVLSFYRLRAITADTRPL
jgi:16S rRNA (guanine966-N2)-methyltransferase